MAPKEPRIQTMCANYPFVGFLAHKHMSVAIKCKSIPGLKVRVPMAGTSLLKIRSALCDMCFLFSFLFVFSNRSFGSNQVEWETSPKADPSMLFSKGFPFWATLCLARGSEFGVFCSAENSMAQRSSVSATHVGPILYNCLAMNILVCSISSSMLL